MNISIYSFCFYQNIFVVLPHPSVFNIHRGKMSHRATDPWLLILALTSFGIKG